MTADPRDLKATFGGVTLDGTHPTVYLTKIEADLRRSLASVAHAYGWDVSEEVVIPGWGRIDLVLDDGGTYLVELKIDLTKPARVRRAFQQADGYGRWWAANKGQPADVLLVGAEIDDATVKAVADAYYTVWPRSTSELLAFLEAGGSAEGRKIRHARAVRRAAHAAEISRIYARTVERLAGRLPELKSVEEVTA